MTLSFGTKAETLERLRPVLRRGVVLPQVKFSVSEWAADPSSMLHRLRDELGAVSDEVIVRSTSAAEDTDVESLAGRFASELNVPLADDTQLTAAIHAVLASYGEVSDDEVVFCQPMVSDVRLSGVVFSRELDSFAPYFVVNLDDTSGRTDSVTHGDSNELRTIVRFRDADVVDPEIDDIIAVTREIEGHFGTDCIDVEFAVDQAGRVIVFQVRPLVTGGRALPPTAEIFEYVEKIHKKLQKLDRRHPYLFGERTILGVMPDWNPAEMIGVKPRTLALSLYKELITDRTWAYQRDNYGYKNLRSFPLMVTLIGHPFIDVRVSFGSFIPAALSEGVSAKLADYYLDKLRTQPDSHDKVEFDILYSCYYLGVGRRLDRLTEWGLEPEEISELRHCLLDLTNDILEPGSVFETDLAKIDELQTRQNHVINSSLSSLEKVYWLVEDCKRYGTLPFAGLARAGFIAVQMLRSMVKEQLLTRAQFDDFMGSLNTVATGMQQARATTTESEFLEVYGHLRPGTYDILSKSYRDAYELYFPEDMPIGDIESNDRDFRVPDDVVDRVDERLKSEGITVEATALFAFIRRAIEGREHAKFIFTRSVNEVLELVSAVADRYGFSDDDASFLDIGTLLDLYATLDHRDLALILKDEIDRNRGFYETTRMIKLPGLILEPDDVWQFELSAGSPNFVTLGRVQAQVVSDRRLLTDELAGKIVLIPSADPGYDWLFARGIAGLITTYGGANSHMAIRAAELRIPAVIGAGETNYRLWDAANVLEIDAANKQVRIIQ